MLRPLRIRIILSLYLGLLLCGCQSVRDRVSAWITPSARPRQISLETRWVRSTLASDYLGARRLHRMTPVMDDEKVIAGNSIDGISAYDRKSGNMRWHFYVSGGVEAGAQLLDDRLYFGAGDGYFYCIDAKTGHEIWKFSIHFEGLGVPLVRNGRVYFLSGNNVAYALNADDGKQLWSYARPESAPFTIRGGSQPSLYGETLYLGFSDGALVALNIKDGSLVWERQLSQNQRFKDVDTTPILDGDNIYISNYDGTLYCLSRADGQIVWRYDEGSSYTVTVDGDKLYFATTSRKLVSLQKETGRVVWSENIPTGLPTQPALLQGFLILGTHDGPLEVRRTQDGQRVASFSPGRGISAPPLAFGEKGEIYFISNEANLYSLMLSWKNPQAAWPWDDAGGA